MTSTDRSLLASVSSKFTEETLRNVLIKLTGDDGAVVTSWNVEAAAGKGDNYLSVVSRVTIDGLVQGKSSRNTVIVKAIPTNKTRNTIFRSKDFFKNETAFYTKVIALFEEFLTKKGKLELLNVPRCLGYLEDGENDFIVLEDAKAKGFSGIDRLKAWKYEDCKVIFKAFAQYHGISLAVLQQQPQELLEATKYLSEPLFTEKFWDWYGRYYTLSINAAQDAMAKEYPGTPQEEKFRTMTSRKLFSKCVELLNERNKSVFVVNHGDSWATNFMTRILPNGDHDAIIFDFQLARCASPVHDLAYFVYTVTDKETRDKYFLNLLKYYHNEMKQIMAELGSNIDDIYPLSLFMEEVKEQFVFGFAFGLETLPMSMLSADESFDLDDTNGEVLNIADIWTLKPTNNKVNRLRLADVVKHGIDHGFL
ncbi:uncharacterized LOC105273004 [Fopius arisanus]|uniref:Uncharacterized LOC105273004 n=2 Tax=Fopius arisanus TaxID=64838 RepID=A0AAR9IHI2_9HYME|nr:uncharacterized LOC105273004 [Fopius arisanus]KAG8362510.1 EcKinase 10 [Fopius arisanus]